MYVALISSFHSIHHYPSFRRQLAHRAWTRLLLLYRSLTSHVPCSQLRFRVPSAAFAVLLRVDLGWPLSFYPLVSNWAQRLRWNWFLHGAHTNPTPASSYKNNFHVLLLVFLEGTGYEARQTSKEQTKIPRFMLEGPRPYAIFLFCTNTLLLTLRNPHYMINSFKYISLNSGKKIIRSFFLPSSLSKAAKTSRTTGAKRECV